MSNIEILEKFNSINVWTRGDERALNKPLLVLIALSKTLREEKRLLGFENYENQLRELLKHFGPQRKGYHPEYPFWRLQNDSIWEVTGEEGLRARDSNTDPPITELRRPDVKGGFKGDIYSALLKDKDLLSKIVKLILSSHFPDSIHEDIISAIGLDLDWKIGRVRDPSFRRNVVRVYSYCCAICGYNVRIGEAPICLEAAHIKWVAAKGPDEVKNGLALCSLHHKAFDRGGIGLDVDYSVLISEDLNGQTLMDELFTRYCGKKINLPKKEIYYPNEEYIIWHRKEVFRSPAI